jgi:hypothetical protein
MGWIGNSFGILVANPERRDLMQELCEDNIKMGLEE